MSTKNKYEIRFKRELLWFCFFSLCAIAIPLVSLLVPFRPDGIALDNWFSRSGAAMIVFALIAESNAFKIFTIFNPRRMVGDGFNDFRTKYHKWPNILNKTAFLLIAFGTFIWGYGDILVNIYSKNLSCNLCGNNCV